MGPAQQRLRPDHGVGLEVHLGLVVQLQLVSFERAAQLAEEGEPRGVVQLAAGRVEDARSPQLPRGLHRRVGAAQQRLGLGPVLRGHRHPHAGRDLDRQPLHHEGPLERAQDALSHLPRESGVGVGQEHPELVAPQPRHAVPVAQGVAQAHGQLAHDEVPVVVAQRVRDLAETVEGQDQQRQRAVGPHGLRRGRGRAGSGGEPGSADPSAGRRTASCAATPRPASAR